MLKIRAILMLKKKFKFMHSLLTQEPQHLLTNFVVLKQLNLKKAKKKQ